VHETFFNLALRILAAPVRGTAVAAIRANYEQAETRCQTSGLASLRVGLIVSSEIFLLRQRAKSNQYGG
jgi:hypothetical protein